MSYPSVLCLGEILFDDLADNLTPSITEVTSWSAYPGGAPANVASGLVKLGTTAGFIGCIGQDPSGQLLVNLLAELGINTSGVQRHLTAPTRRIYVLRSNSGDREFAGFGNFDTREFADTKLQADLLPVELFVNADFLVLGTLGLAYPHSRQAVGKAIEMAENHYVKILVDVNWRSMFWPDPDMAKPLILQLLQDADFLKLSAEEAQWLFNTTDPGSISHNLCNLEGVLVTDGDQGCSYCFGDHTDRIPAFSVSATDTTGAGDSFVAGFVHLICQHGVKSLADPVTAKRIITYASAAGALSTTKMGALSGQPHAQEVETFLAQNILN